MTEAPPSLQDKGALDWITYHGTWGPTLHLAYDQPVKVDNAGERAACGQYLYSQAVDRSMPNLGHVKCKRCARKAGW